MSIILATVWIHLIHLPHYSKVPIRQSSTVILGDFSSFYYKEVLVAINEDSLPNVTRDFNYGIDIYGKESTCDNIRAQDIYDLNIDVVLTEKNISKFTPLYALGGSSFKFELYGNVSPSQNEFVDVCVHAGSRYGDGKIIECVRKPLLWSVGRYEITDPGYYFFTVKQLNGSAKYSIILSGSIKKIHVSTSELLGCSLSESSHDCHIQLPGKKNTYCLVAEFYKLPYHSAITELDAEVGKTRGLYVVGITLVPLLVCVVLLVISCSSGILCTKYFCRKRNKLSLHKLTYSI